MKFSTNSNFMIKNKKEKVIYKLIFFFSIISIVILTIIYIFKTYIRFKRYDLSKNILSSYNIVQLYNREEKNNISYNNLDNSLENIPFVIGIINTMFICLYRSFKINYIIYYNVINCQLIEYIVFDMFEIEPNDSSCMSQNTNGEKIITLLTCNNVNGKRLIIKAKESK